MKKYAIAMISLILVLSLFVGAMPVSALEENYKYEEQVKKLFFEKYSFIPEENWNGYREHYEYFSSDSTVPDYVLLTVYVTKSEIDCVEIIGDYVIALDHTYFPNKTPYYIYVPSQEKLYTIAELYNSAPELFDALWSMRSAGLRLIGDADQDRQITIRDATWLQKKLAGYSMTTDYGGDAGFRKEKYVEDFNRDGVLNIQDATAIQKYLSGITGTYAEDVKEPVDNPFSRNVSIEDDYTDDCIIVVTKCGWGHDYTLENFPEYEFSSIKKIGGRNNEGYAFYELKLKNPGKENVIEAIKALDYRAKTDLEAVSPNYIYIVMNYYGDECTI